MALNLEVGTKIKIGEKYNASVYNTFKKDEVITLVKGEFDCDNGLYETIEEAPSIWNEQQKEFDSIFHLFGNDLENFMDCEVVF